MTRDGVPDPFDLTDPRLLAIHADEIMLALYGTREEVESGDISPTLASLNKLLEPGTARRFRGRVIFGIRGYDDDPRELHYIPEVVLWMRELDREFAYWFYFVQVTNIGSLAFLTFTLCDYVKVPGAARVAPEVLREFVERKLVAMNKLCTFLGETDAVRHQRTREVLECYEKAPG
ncbi:MAG TPA: hypothetical protein VM223_15135 [Planctomycetota bacterium]|nr:hypothetical protein [Planctomycetota bacterium]